ncbi:LigA [Burkholderia sp. IT-111MI5]
MGAEGSRPLGLARRVRLLLGRRAAPSPLQYEHRRRRQTLLPGVAEPGRRRADRGLRVARDRQPRADEARLAAVGRVRADDLRGRDDGVERAVLQRQGARRAAPRAVRGDPARRRRVRARVVRPAADAVLPVRAVRVVRLRVLGLHGDPRARESGALVAARSLTRDLPENGGREAAVFICPFFKTDRRTPGVSSDCAPNGMSL